MSELHEVLELPYWRHRQARVVVAALEASGKSLRRFAREHGVTASRLRRWRRRLRREPAPGERSAEDAATPRLDAIELVPVTVREPRELPRPGLFAPPMTLDVVVGPATVRVPHSFDEQHLRRVVAVLASC